ncbi:DUF4625 domain-containing protein [Owenweeksia hongkongensis]|uniref:DUF4625 domain-containing protein n=1 Tax=Owenweeksia hongkongensis (strain DSM 17368 / CIP 108786 / JCM 12287 / NRRL B-23963 / UST20020801) TaxID=926562 RepID=G8QZT3_OWEHD|nr:DUF4625 domain-containing protein [Owenweeksia hongkongensis]AEV31527.1 hypothetical protein Oweho_0511 [Owenweeksia hongkongensis DSM 17368]
MKTVFKVLLPIVGSAFLMASCDKDDDNDTTAPIIKSATIDGKVEDIEVTAGTAMTFVVEVSDNEDLGQLKLDVHDNFDGHTHKSTASVSWAEVKIVELSGTDKTVTQEMNVPAEATAGPYHADILLIDAEGNEGEFVERSIMIRNGSEPGINVTNPDLSGEVHATKGSTLTIEGTVSDDVDLAEIYIVLEEEHDDDHDHKSTQEEALYEMDFDLTGSADVSWDFQTDGNVNIAIPANAETGHYELTIRAEDAEGNINILSGEIHIM